MKKLAVSIIFLMLLFSSCSNTYVYKIDGGSKPADSGEKQDASNTRVLRTMEEDLDGDTVPEKIEVMEVKSTYEDMEELSGKLMIYGKDRKREIVYKESGSALTGVFKDIEVLDVNEDGYPEVFLTIPDVGGGGYTLNYFFIYNYKLDKRLSFDQQFSMDYLDPFIKSFALKYEHPGKVLVYFKGGGKNFIINVPEEADGDFYNNSWIDPSPVMIQEDSENIISYADIAEGKKSPLNIRVPLIIFGGSTSNVIGEVDVFIALDSKLTPSIEGFEIYKLAGDSSREKIGDECLN